MLRSLGGRDRILPINRFSTSQSGTSVSLCMRKGVVGIVLQEQQFDMIWSVEPRDCLHPFSLIFVVGGWKSAKTNSGRKLYRNKTKRSIIFIDILCQIRPAAAIFDARVCWLCFDARVCMLKTPNLEDQWITFGLVPYPFGLSGMGGSTRRSFTSFGQQSS